MPPIKGYVQRDTNNELSSELILPTGGNQPISLADLGASIVENGIPAGTGLQILGTSGVAGVPTLLTPNSPGGPILSDNAGLVENLQLLGNPSTALGAVPKQYVDSAIANVVASLSFTPNKNPVNHYAAIPLPTNTYNNGTAGVGATLTATANGVLTIDGVAVVLNDRVSVGGEANLVGNGFYLCTTAGAVGTAYVLTRSTDANTPALLGSASAMVAAGTTYTGWGVLVAQASGAITIGTTGITFQLQPLSIAAEVAARISVTGPAVKLASSYNLQYTSLSGFYGPVWTDESTPPQVIFGVTTKGKVVTLAGGDLVATMTGTTNYFKGSASYPLLDVMHGWGDMSTPVNLYAWIKRSNGHFISLGIDVTAQIQTVAGTFIVINGSLSIACMGNSLTSGYPNNYAASAYPQQLAVLMGRTVLNLGIAGQIAMQVAGRAGAPVMVGFTNLQITSGANAISTLNGVAPVAIASNRNTPGQFLDSISDSAGTRTQAGTLAIGSGIHGTMTRVSTGTGNVSVYSFTPDAGFTGPINCINGAIFIADVNTGYIPVLEFGSNDTQLGSVALPTVSMVCNGGTVTVQMPNLLTLPVGFNFSTTIAGVAPSGYNGTYNAVVTGSNSFTFPLASNPGNVTTQGTYLYPGASAAVVFAAIQQSIEYILAKVHTAPKRWIMMSLTNGSQYHSGQNFLSGGYAPAVSPFYTLIVQVNQMLAAAYPDNFLDIRSILINSYNPADPRDVFDFNCDVTPSSLHVQGTSTLAAAITTTGQTAITLPTGLGLNTGTPILVGSECMFLQTYASGTGAATVVRAQGGSTAATYASGTAFSYVGDALHYGTNGYAIFAQAVQAFINAKGW